MSKDTIMQKLTVKFQEQGTLRIYGATSDNNVTFVIEQSYTKDFNFGRFAQAIKNEFHGESLQTLPIAREGRFSEIIFTVCCLGREVRNPRDLLRAVRRRLVSVVSLVEENSKLDEQELRKLLSELDTVGGVERPHPVS